MENMLHTPEEYKEGEAILDVRAYAIREVKNFEELYRALEAFGSVQGSREAYTAESLIEMINIVREGKLDPKFITNAHKLRDKVVELLENERREKTK